MQNSFNIRITKILDGLNLPNPFEEEIIEEKQEPPIIDLNPINLNDLQNSVIMPESEFITNNFFNENPLSKNSNCSADKSAIWIWNTFGQCVLSNVEMFGFYLGMISILCWMVSTIPQLIMNYKSGKVDQSLSVWFLIFWLAGDTCNMVGCILSKQLPMQIQKR